MRDCDFAASKRKWAVKCHAIVAALKGLEGWREEERKGEDGEDGGGGGK